MQNTELGYIYKAAAYWRKLLWSMTVENSAK